MVYSSQEIQDNIYKENIEYLREAIYNNGINCRYTLLDDTLLHVAARNNKKDIVKFLIDEGADIEARSANGLTPLHEASLYDSFVAMKVLVDSGANIEAKNADGCTPLHTMNYMDIKTFKYLLECGADKEARSNSNETALHMAARINVKAVQALIEGGANIEAEDSKFETPLHKATRHRDDDVIVKTLLQAGANTGARDEDGRTPLHRAMQRNFIKIALALIEGGADINARDLDGQTSLHIAATYAFVDLMKQLIAKGVDYTIRDEQGRTCVDILKSTKKGIRYVSEFSKYETKHKSDGINRILMQLCELEDIKDLMSEIKKRVNEGENINAVDSGGMTLIHWAAAYRNIEAMKELIKMGADHNLRNHGGKTCMDMIGDANSESVRNLEAFILGTRLNKRARYAGCGHTLS